MRFQTKLVQHEARLLEKMTQICTPAGNGPEQDHSDPVPAPAPAEDEPESVE